jgi:hypothetical protein
MRFYLLLSWPPQLSRDVPVDADFICCTPVVFCAAMKERPCTKAILFSTCGICVFVLVVTAANRIVDFFLFLLWFICRVFLFKLHDDICDNIFQHAVSFLPNVGLKQYYCFLNMSGWNSAVASIKAGIQSEKK